MIFFVRETFTTKKLLNTDKLVTNEHSNKRTNQRTSEQKMTIYDDLNEFCSAVVGHTGTDPEVLPVNTRKPRSPSPTNKECGMIDAAKTIQKHVRGWKSRKYYPLSSLHHNDTNGYSIAPIGYEACYGCGWGPNIYRGTSQTRTHRGYSHILFNGRPCFWAENSDGTGERSFPKASVSHGIIMIDGSPHYVGKGGEICKIDDRFGTHLGYGR